MINTCYLVRQIKPGDYLVIEDIHMFDYRQIEHPNSQLSMKLINYLKIISIRSFGYQIESYWENKYNRFAFEQNSWMDILPWVLMVSKSTLLTKSHFPSESEMVEIKQLEEDFEYNQVESLLISGFSLYGMSDQDYSYSLKLAAKAIERQRLFPVSYSPPRYPHNINFNIFQELRKAREYNRVAGFFPK